MTDPARIHDPITEAVEVVVYEEPDQDELEGIVPEDFAPLPEFADFEVWCDIAEDWALAWRPEPDHAWRCRNCGSTQHRFRDHEGAGA